MSGCHADIGLRAIAAKSLGLRGCEKLVVMLGTPNSGKSTLFNALTGGRARVGNWPGVTVDVHVGRLGGVCVLDLPGVYGLGGVGSEESAAKRALLTLRPDLVVVLLDGASPEKSMYLLIDAAEAFPGKLVVAVSKYALSHGLGVHIDSEGLSRAVGAPVILTSALEGVGLDLLAREVREGPSKRQAQAFTIDYGPAEAYVSGLASKLESLARSLGVSPRWLAAALLAGDRDVASLVASLGGAELVDEARRLADRLGEEAGAPAAFLIAEAKARAAETLASSVIVRRKPVEAPSWIDRVYLHPILGPVAGALTIFTVFLAAFTVNTGFPLNYMLYLAGLKGLASALEEYSLAGLIAAGFEKLASLLSGDAWWTQLAHGVLDGVGLVAGFIPLVAALVAGMTLLDDSGFLARVAVSFHSLFKAFGLSGRSLYPLLTGLGCNVPAAMLTRTLPPEERLRALAAIPYMPCSARLIVIAAFSYAFFTGTIERAIAATGVYIASMIAGLLAARLVAFIQSRRIGVEEKPELIMELPLVHKPSLKVTWWATRDAVRAFIKKMSGPILVGSIIVWLLLNVSAGSSGVEATLGYRLGSIVGAIFSPIGLNEWQEAVMGLALIGGSLVKELIVGIIGIAAGNPDPAAAVAALGLTKAQAVSLLLFTTMYIPCIGTLVAVASESRSRRFTVALAIYMALVSTATAYAVYWLLATLGV